MRLDKSLLVCIYVYAYQRREYSLPNALRELSQMIVIQLNQMK